jgi:membrane-bound lytic murein transglycosylase A
MRVTELAFGDLEGWASDDLSEAFCVFRETAGHLPGPAWGRIAERADQTDAGGAGRFFETEFRAVLIEDGMAPLFTGYYEPELPGSRVADEVFRWPVHALPGDPRGHDRAEIVAGALEGRGLEIVWLADAAEAFFLQVQGSGRIVLPDGEVLRLNYAGSNGRPYRPVGKELVARGVFTAGNITAEGIKHWIRANPEAGREVMDLNPSYVFFRLLEWLPPGVGPLGCMGHPVTALRSVAVDPEVVPLGAPVWLEAGGLRRLMVAQDRGGAIRGAQRADVFFGTGAEAGRRAGAFLHPGRMVVLLPRDEA